MRNRIRPMGNPLCPSYREPITYHALHREGVALATVGARPVASASMEAGEVIAEFRPGYRHALPRLIAILRSRQA